MLMDDIQSLALFLDRCFSTKRQEKCLTDESRCGNVRRLLQSLGKLLGLLQHKGVIEHRECLQSSRRLISSGSYGRGIGTIQDLHQRMRNASNRKPVDAASPCFRSCFFHVGINGGVSFLNLKVFEARSRHLVIQTARHLKHRIANRLC